MCLKPEDMEHKDRKLAVTQSSELHARIVKKTEGGFCSTWIALYYKLIPNMQWARLVEKSPH